MSKGKSAAERTLIHPAVSMREIPQPEPFVKCGPTLVREVVEDYPPAIHYFRPAGDASLCGEACFNPISGEKRSILSGYGTCAACRVEASKLRAVVK